MIIQFAPSPSRVETYLAGYEVSAALWSAIDLNLFTAIAEGHHTLDALALRCHAHPRGIRILSDYLVLNGFLTKNNNAYQLTPESQRYLDHRSPSFLGKMADFRHSPFVWGQYGRLTEFVRQGGASVGSDVLQPDHDLWIRFARVMADQMSDVAKATVPIVKTQLNPNAPRPLKILDIAAGHGMFGIMFAKDDPTCRIVAQDWPKILDVTRENALAHGVADRFTFIPGDILQTDVGGDYDLVLIPNLIHYLDRDANVRLLKKARAALKPGGLVAIAEYALNEDRVSPLYAIFSLFVLAMTPSGEAYTVKEILSMCAEAGFGPFSVWDVPVQRLLIVANPLPAEIAASASPLPSPAEFEIPHSAQHHDTLTDQKTLVAA
jgi:2-polyprenyl-3-methyl-5-hydroxy-6-metoxy-1,4-benzoquinol methylase